MLRVGLTGGIAAGKSTVAARLVADGARLIDYDLLAHQVLASGGQAVEAVVGRFGRQVLAADGSVDRPLLAALVFGGARTDRARADLDAIVHPAVYRQAARLEEEWADRPLVVVHDVPLLAQVGGHIPFSFDRVLDVEAPADVRIARMVNARHMTRDQAVGRIRSQASEEDRRRLADIVIDGSLPIEQMFDSVDRIYRDLASEAEETDRHCEA